MAVKATQQLIRSFRLTVFIENGEGEKAEDILIKYRPVTEEWLERWGEIAEKEEAELAEDLERITKEYREEVEKLAKEAKEAEGKGVAFDEQAARERLSKNLEQAREKLKEKKQKSLLVRQLACDHADPPGLLIDIDHVDDDGNRIPPTQEFLHTRDKALLVEIQETIEKKLAPAQRNGRR